MAISTGRASTRHSRLAFSASIPLRAASISGVGGLVLRLATDDPFVPSRSSIFGYPASGVVPALAGAVGVVLIGLTLAAAYAALTDRRIAQRVAAIAIGVSLVLAVGGLGLAFDAALGGAVVLAIGLGIGARPGSTPAGWIGVLAGAIALAASFPAPTFEAAGQARAVAETSALSAGLFVVAVSVALWRRAGAIAMNQQGVDR